MIAVSNWGRMVVHDVLFEQEASPKGRTGVMQMRAMLAILVVFLYGAQSASANGYKARRHYPEYVVAQPQIGPVNQFGGRLVYHPAFNIACQTHYRATRALPCDQPVWVYGSPCEIDLGLGRYRPCD
jgi:hypothetical protein